MRETSDITPFIPKMILSDGLFGRGFLLVFFSRMRHLRVFPSIYPRDARLTPNSFYTLLLLLGNVTFVHGVCDFTVTSGSLVRDYGEIPHGRAMCFNVSVQNNSSETVRIGNIQRSCVSCTPLEFSCMTIAQGQEISIRTDFNSGNTPGRQNRKYFIRTEEDPSTVSLEVSLTWVVAAFPDCIPPIYEFGQKGYASIYNGNFILQTQDIIEDVKIIGMKSNTSSIELGIPELLSGKKGYQIPFQILPTIPAGPFTEKIEIVTDYKKDPRSNLTITGTVQGPFRLSKRYFNFGPLSPVEIPNKRIEIIEDNPIGYNISLDSWDDSMINCILSKNPESGYLIDATVRPGQVSGFHSCLIILKTSCWAQPELKIPVLMVIRPPM